MAEQIPFSVAERLSMELGSLALKEIGSLYGVQRELRKLENTLHTIKAGLVDAEKQQQQEKSKAVETWVRRLKVVVYEGDDLFDDFAVQHHLRPRTDNKRRLARLEIIGKEENKWENTELLILSGNEANLSIAAIVGVGGFGKDYPGPIGIQ